MEKVRCVIDYNKLSDELRELFEDTYPDGLAGNTIRFQNAKNEMVTAARIETEEKVYLVRINVQPVETFNPNEVEDFIDDYDKEFMDDSGDNDDDFDD